MFLKKSVREAFKKKKKFDIFHQPGRGGQRVFVTKKKKKKKK